MKKYKKIIKIVFCILMIFTIVAAPVVESYAIAQVVLFVGGAAVLGSLLTAYGYSNLTSTDVNNLYNSMPTNLKTSFQVASTGIAQAFGMVSVGVVANVINEFVEWFGEEVPGGTLPLGDIPLPTEFVSTWNNIYSAYAIGLMASSNFNYQVYVNGNPSYGGYGSLYQSNSPIYYRQNNPTSFEIRCIDGTMQQTPIISLWNGSGNVASSGTTVTGMNNGVSINTGVFDMQVHSVNTPIDFVDANNNYMYTFDGVGGGTGGGTPTYVINNYYNYATNPLPVAADGTVKLTMPYTDNPDTNVSIPGDNSIDNPVSLETVLNGYESIDGYFEQGGAITLADGTVIGDISEGTRATEWDNATETGTGAVPGESTWVDGIPILGSILQAIRQVADNTNTAESDWSIDWRPITSLNFTTIFPFCIPFDFIHLVGTFAASPSDYQMRIYLNNPYFTVDHTVNLAPFYIPIQFFRAVVVATFLFILINKTRSMIKW